MKAYTYLLLHAVIIFFPLLRSFEEKINFYRNWRFLFPGMLVSASFFIGWDVWFTDMHVWHFNSDYVIGIYLLGLPLEEWMFFFTVPFACVFIYEALNFYIRKDYFKTFAKHTNIVLITMFLLLAILNYTKLYTVLSLFTAALILTLYSIYFRNKLSGRFYLAYLVHLIPFFAINGMLTSLPVVIYNDQENLGIRIGTIPIEDMAYSMALLLMNIGFYEYFKEAGIKQRIV